MRLLTSKWIWMIIGIIGTWLAVKAAYMERGYFAIGSEWIFLPMILIVVGIISNLKSDF